MESIITQTGLTLYQVGSEFCLDSREVSKRLGIEHKHFMETLRTYQSELEELGVMPFQTAKPSKGSPGGRPETYALLSYDQAIFAATLSRNTKQVVAFKLLLTKAFAEARNFIASQPQQPVSLTPLADRIAKTYEFLEDRIPEGYWAIITELHREVRTAELLGKLDGEAFPEISAGKRWAKYAREILGLPIDDYPSYPHYDPARPRSGEQAAKCYPLALLTTFRRWFRDIYLPHDCPLYVAYRHKRIERQLPSPRTNKQIEP